jgi:P27 family predicted phage terminase small subunit
LGRKPRPTALKILHGEPNKNRINTREPKPTALKTTCPSHLSQYAKAEWRRIVPELEGMGIFTKIDRAALSAYCQAYGRWVDCELKIKEIQAEAAKNGKDSINAYLLKTQSGNIIINPLMSVSNRALEQMRQFLTEFGLTPVSRTRINTDADTRKEDEFEELLSRNRDN